MTTKSSLQGNVGMDADNPVAPPFTNGPYSTDQDHDFKSLVNVSGHMGLNFNRTCLVEYFKQKPGINADLTPSSADDSNDGATKAELDTMNLTNKFFEVLGSGASTDDVTFNTTTSGLLLTTDSSGSQQVIIAPHLNTTQSAWLSTLWGTENQVIWEAVVRTGTSVASITLWAGLKLTNDQDITTDNDQAFFRFDAGVANWEAVYTVGGTSDVEVDTGVVVAINTTYYFRIEIDSSRIAHFYIDNNEVATSAALTDDVDLIPYVGVEGNAKTFILVSEAISRIIFE